VIRKRTGIFISGRGSNMLALIEAARRPDFPAEIVLVLSNRADAAGLAVAENCGVATAAVDHKIYAGREEFERSLQLVLDIHRIELICLAGFKRILSATFIERWRGRIINIHPSLLPEFRGLDTHRRALDAGVKVHGCTVHFVEPELDAGPIIAQRSVPVLGDDTPESLAARVLEKEHEIYPQALALVASGRARFETARNRPKTTFPQQF
jgi:phosphoribosylglycinamide formyltransferase-1